MLASQIVFNQSQKKLFLIIHIKKQMWELLSKMTISEILDEA